MKKTPQLLVTPTGMIFQDHWYTDVARLLNTLKDSKIKKVQVLMDGFPLTIGVETLPKLGYFDRHAYLKRRLDHGSSGSFWRGYACVAPHRGVYVTQAPHPKMTALLDHLRDADIQVLDMQPFVFMAHELLHKFCISQRGEGVLWISPLGQEGVRIVFWDGATVRYVRHLTDPQDTLKTEILKTISYLEEEFFIDRQQMAVVDTTHLIPQDIGISFCSWEQTYPEMSSFQHSESWLMTQYGGQKVFQKVFWENQPHTPQRFIHPQQLRSVGWGIIISALILLGYQSSTLYKVEREIQGYERDVGKFNPALTTLLQERPEVISLLKAFEEKPWVLETLEKLERAGPEVEVVSEVFVEKTGPSIKLKVALLGHDEMGLEEALKAHFKDVKKTAYHEGKADAFILEP